MNESILKEGKIYTAFPEGHFKRKIDFDITQRDPGYAGVACKLDMHPEVEILPTCFSFNARFEFTSDMFDIQLYLYQRVDFSEALNIKEGIKKDKDIIKRVMKEAIPHIVERVYQFGLNMGFEIPKKILLSQ